jgi:hypothetical protein
MLCQLVAAAADLCRKPLLHAVLPTSTPALDRGDDMDWCLRLEVRNADGERRPEQDLDLELYTSSGGELHLTLAWSQVTDGPMLWHGGHPVWMDAVSGQRCERPAAGPPLEALARRLRALLL